MNDFTKEELKSIMYCVKQMKIHIDGYNPLKSKIQFMIDNYCEHTESKTIVNYDNDFVSVCVKCGVQL